MHRKLFVAWWGGALVCVSLWGSALKAQEVGELTEAERATVVKDADGQWMYTQEHLDRCARILRLRYPDGRARRLPEAARIEETAEEIVITSERSELHFSKRMAAVVQATAMGEALPVKCVPNVSVTDAAGEVYEQAASGEGDLRVVAEPTTADGELDEGNYIHLEGEFTPGKDGAQGPVSFAVHYRIHKVTGLTIVDLRVVEARGPVRRLVARHVLGPNAAEQYRFRRYMQNGLIGENHELSTAPAVDVGDVVPFATWSDGTRALEVTGFDWKNFQNSDAYFEETGRRYLTVETGRGGTRCLDVYCITSGEGEVVDLEAGTLFRWGYSVLPWRKYKPLYEMYTGRFDYEFTNEADRENGRLAAQNGITSSFCYQNGDRGSAMHDGKEWLMMHSDVETNGLTRILYIDYMTYGTANASRPWQDEDQDGFWKTWAGFTLWMNKDRAYKNLFMNLWTARDYAHYDPVLGMAKGNWPITEGAGLNLCINSLDVREYMIDWLKQSHKYAPFSMIYNDDVGAAPCSNELHGCMKPGRAELWGQMIVMDRVQAALKDAFPTVRFLVQPQNVFSNSWAAAEYANPGEQGPSGLPTEAESNTIYNPLLYGTTTIIYTESSGHRPKNDIRQHEMALRNGCLILYNKMTPVATEDQDEWYARYYSPLGIYDIESSTIRHWKEPEYSQYVEADLARVKPVLYERAGDVLLVAVRAGDEVDERASFEVKVKELGLAGGALVFDTIKRTLTAMAEVDGRLKFENVPVQDGPQIYRLMRTPDRPAVVWHDQVGWRVVKEVEEAATRRLMIELAGVPLSEAMVYVYDPSATEPAGANLVSWDGQSKLAVYKVAFDGDAKATLGLSY